MEKRTNYEKRGKTMLKRIVLLGLVLSLLLALSGCGEKSPTDDVLFSGGTGTEADPYIIATAQDLWELADLANEKESRDTFAAASYMLTADIDLGSKNWTPIGTEAVPFSGILDGNGHTVRGLRLSGKAGSGSNAFGFVGQLKGTVRNLTIADSSIRIKGDSGYTGALVGKSMGGTVENCHTTDTVEVSSEYQVGGICGNLNSSSTLRGCTNGAKVTSTGHVGCAAGIASYVSCPVEDCTNNGAIESEGDAAGIAGSAGGGVSNCANNGSVSARGYSAGIVCRFSDGALNSSMNDASVTLLGCVNNGDVTSREDPAGGIAVSCRTGRVVDCVNNGNITSPEETGGIFAYFQQGVFGEAAPEFLVSGCSSSGQIISLDSYGAGGICGEVYGSTTRVLFENCENTGSVQATGKADTVGSGSEAGGIIGCANVTSLQLTNCTNSGRIRGFAYAGGLVGRAYPDHSAEVEETEFVISSCSNSGSIHTTEPGGLKKDVYAGGIVGHCRVITEDVKLLPAFDRIVEENCENSGSITADDEKSIPHCSEIFGNAEDFES